MNWNEEGENPVADIRRARKLEKRNLKMSNQEFYMPWGLHRGKHIDYVPRSYLEHLLEQKWINEKKHETLVKEIEDQLAMRDRSYIDW